MNAVESPTYLKVTLTGTAQKRNKGAPGAGGVSLLGTITRRSIYFSQVMDKSVKASVIPWSW